MTIEEIEERFSQRETEYVQIEQVCQSIEVDAHMEFIESLRRLVNK